LATRLRAKTGPEAAVVAMDLAEPGAAARLGEEVDRRGLTVDLLVNNAAMMTGIGAKRCVRAIS